MDEKRFIEMIVQCKHKRNKHKENSKHYWRYSGKIEVLNELLQEITKSRR